MSFYFLSHVLLLCPLLLESTRKIIFPTRFSTIPRFFRTLKKYLFLHKAYRGKGGVSGGRVHIAYSTTKPKTYSNAQKIVEEKKIKNAFTFKICTTYKKIQNLFKIRMPSARIYTITQILY